MIAINMQMPEKCGKCRFHLPEQDWCAALPIDDIRLCYYEQERPEWCPLFEVKKVVIEKIIPHEDITFVPESEILKYITVQNGKNIGELILNTDGLHHRSIRPIQTKSFIDTNTNDNYWLDSKIVRDTCWVVEAYDGKEK